MTAAAIRRFTDTTPEGRPLLSISVARHLAQIEAFTGTRPTISNCVMSCRMHPETLVDDPTPSERLYGARVIANEIVSQFFSGGVAEADYVLTYLITFSDSSIEAFDVIISVRPFMGL